MFGERLKKLRKERGLTQRQLADMLEIGRPTIAGYETKRKEPDYLKLILLANFFDVSVDYLIGNSQDRNNKNIPLINDQEDQIIKRILKNTGLLEPDGKLSEKSEKVITDFIINNAELLKKLIENEN